MANIYNFMQTIYSPSGVRTFDGRPRRSFFYIGQGNLSLKSCRRFGRTPTIKLTHLGSRAEVCFRPPYPRGFWPAQ